MAVSGHMRAIASCADSAHLAAVRTFTLIYEALIHLAEVAAAQTIPQRQVGAAPLRAHRRNG